MEPLTPWQYFIKNQFGSLNRREVVVEIKDSRIFRGAHTGKNYVRVNGPVRARVGSDGKSIMLEGSIPVTKGQSDVGFQLPLDAVVDLVRLALEARQTS